MVNLAITPASGKGIVYIMAVIQAYVVDNQVSDLNDRDTARIIASEIMSGLGVFEDSLVYKEAIVRKLTWIVIRIAVSNTIYKMFPGRDPIWLEGVVNTCMDEGTSDWYRPGVMKLGISNIIETYCIR